MTTVTGTDFEIRNPYSGALVGRAPQTTDDQLRAALDQATAPALTLSPDERAAVLDRAADAYERDADAAALLITTEAGICRKQAAHEVRRSVAALRAAAAEARRLGATDWAAAYRVPGGPPTPTAAELHVVPKPVALAVAITPFNHPLNQVVHKVAPAVAAGAPIVLKPSEKAPLSALRLAEVRPTPAFPPTPSPSSPAGRRRPSSTSLPAPPGGAGELHRQRRRGPGHRTRHGRPRQRAGALRPELGGDAALVVLADADVERAARIALDAFDNAASAAPPSTASWWNSRWRTPSSTTWSSSPPVCGGATPSTPTPTSVL